MKKRSDKSKISLKSVNMIFTANIHLLRKFSINEMSKIIDNGRMDWGIINQEKSPMLQAHIRDEANKRNICLTLWSTGALGIAGVRSKKEAKKYYVEAKNELERIAGDAFKKNG